LFRQPCSEGLIGAAPPCSRPGFGGSLIPRTNNKTAGTEKREKLKKEYWPAEDAWTGDNEKGWFRAPRTLPLLLTLLGEKSLSGKFDPSRVYLELLARHMDAGVIEMSTEEDHAYAAGYSGQRGVRTWQERIKTLEKLGVIKTKQIGNQRIRYVLLIHPTTAIQRLRDSGKISTLWWETYRSRQIETKELTHEARQKNAKLTRAISLVPRTLRKAKKEA
jgi:hypothetical protein